MMCDQKWGAGVVSVVVALLFVAGCSTAILDDNLAGALDATVNQARFDLECREVQTSVLSGDVVDGTPSDGSQHTIQASGCGRQAVYVVRCADSTDCTAVEKPGQVQEFKPQIEP